MDNRTKVLMIYPDFYERLDLDLDVKYSIRSEYYEQYEKYDNAIKNDFDFYFWGWEATSKTAIKKTVQDILNWQPDLSHVLYGVGDDCDWYYHRNVRKNSKIEINDLVNALSIRGLPCIPMSMCLDGPMDNEFSFRGFYDRTLELITSLPRTLYSRVYQTPKWMKNTEQELIRYLSIHPEKMLDMSPRGFEELVATIFKSQSFDVELTPESRDGGVDVIAVRNNKLIGSETFLIQCKRYTAQKVSIGAVQRLWGAVNQYKASKGLLITTSSFTTPAKEVVRSSNQRILLKDYQNLVSWLNDITAQFK